MSRYKAPNIAITEGYYKDFIKVYLESYNNQEVADKLKIKKSSVTEIASRLRRHGVNLPHRFGPRLTTDFVTELNDLIDAVESQFSSQVRANTKPRSKLATPGSSEKGKDEKE